MFWMSDMCHLSAWMNGQEKIKCESQLFMSYTYYTSVRTACTHTQINTHSVLRSSLSEIQRNRSPVMYPGVYAGRLESGDFGALQWVLYYCLTMSWDDLQYDNSTRYSGNIAVCKICTKKLWFAVLTMNGRRKRERMCTKNEKRQFRKKKTASM